VPRKPKPVNVEGLGNCRILGGQDRYRSFHFRRLAPGGDDKQGESRGCAAKPVRSGKPAQLGETAGSPLY
jgi:hypothetical protein